MGGDTEQRVVDRRRLVGIERDAKAATARRLQIGRTNKGYRLSASTTSAAAARPSGLDVATAVTRSSR
jgi:hypothetical protein